MRPFAVTVAFLAAAIALAAPAAAFDRAQWSGERAADGFYRLWCDACTDGSLLAFEIEPPRTVADAAGFRARLAGQVPGFAKAGILATTGEVRRSAIGAYTLYRATRTLAFANGRKQVGPVGMLVGDEVSVEFYSLSLAPAVAERNFSDFATYLAHHAPRPGWVP
ncbi:hypothetical protein EYW49_09680 [Siculibacillus lacustris]|uniref:DUF1795 domain-containing protein n=1 Tax=Siculibacillus lacustris TaxID=1549641 RepID=A0A4Q9VT05_9HYPH|nr:hypothetical protein [Siculibacillus lacustris]TBW38211.1 hypothetical protein EYW49_09680 [Siculibacillus lacustris]